MQTPRNPSISHSIAAYLVCIGLVPFYVNMFPLWKLLSTRFGDRLFVYIPVIVTLLLFLLLVSIPVIRSKGRNPRARTVFPAMIIGIVLCIAGLLIPDPAYPVKRIHVAEYVLLALIARFAMAPFVHGIPLLFFSSCFGAIMGIHDEFLQGLHPARTYGLRDMSVNALASFGGGFLGHGLSLFVRDRSAAQNDRLPPTDKPDWFYPCWLLACVAMLAVPAFWFKGLTIDTWTIVPLVGSTVYFLLYRNRFRNDLGHGMTAVSLAAWSLACYPPVSSLQSVTFY